MSVREGGLDHYSPLSPHEPVKWKDNDWKKSWKSDWSSGWDNDKWSGGWNDWSYEQASSSSSKDKGKNG